MLGDKYTPYNDEWNYKIDLLNTLERIADSVAPIVIEEPVVVSLIEEEVIEEVKEEPKTKRRNKKEVK